MKAKYIVLLVVCAIITLSFTLGTKVPTAAKVENTEATQSQVAGGIASEDPIR